MKYAKPTVFDIGTEARSAGGLNPYAPACVDGPYATAGVICASGGDGTAANFDDCISGSVASSGGWPACIYGGAAEFECGAGGSADVSGSCGSGQSYT